MIIPEAQDTVGVPGVGAGTGVGAGVGVGVGAGVAGGGVGAGVVAGMHPGEVVSFPEQENGSPHESA